MTSKHLATSSSGFFLLLLRRCPLSCTFSPSLSDQAFLELRTQLAFTTSSQKKRRITRQSTREHDKFEDLVLPSTEDDNNDPTFSFSAASTSDLGTPTYLRADSLPASGVPPRLQSQGASFADSPSSAASSPCAASTDLSIDFDRNPDLLDAGSATSQLPDYGTTRDPSPVHHSVRRALMGGAADFPQRSSSPLKRRASSMEPEHDAVDAREDVDMTAVPDSQRTETAEGSSEEQAQNGTEEPQVPVANMKKPELPLRTGNADFS